MAATPGVPSDNFIFRLSRVLGLFPFKNNPQLEQDWLLLGYSVAVTGAVTVTGTVATINTFSPHLGGFYNKVIITTCNGGYLLIFPCGLIQVFLRRRIVQEALHDIRVFQTRLERIGLRPISRRTQLIPIIDISFFILSRFFLQYLTHHGDYNTSSVSVTFHTLVQFGMLLVCSQYSYLVYSIGDVFRSAVDFLNGMKRSVALPQQSRKVSEVVYVVNKLATASEAINKIYSLQIFLTLSLCFLGLSITMYYTCLFVTSPIALPYILLMNAVYNVLFLFYLVWKVNQSSAETTDKSKAFNVALYKVMMEDKTNEILSDDNLWLHIMMKREVVFSACGFINLDYSSVHSMLASVTTYLAILLQFGQPLGLEEAPSSIGNVTTTPFPVSVTTLA